MTNFINARLYVGLLAIGVAVSGTGFAQAENYALLVGVKQYPRTELTSLKYTEADVSKLADVLISRGYDKRNIELLTQGEGTKDINKLPTAENIRTSLKLILAGLKRTDTIIVAFSGHGVQFKGDTANYFCPMDARLARRSTLISLKTVFEQLEQCGAAGKVLLVDACRDDPQTDLAKSGKRIPLEPIKNRRPPTLEGGTVALFSCSPGEQSFEDPNLKHGVFFHYVIRGMGGEADLLRDGTVSAKELETFVTTKVKDYVRSELRQIQIPSRRGGGEVKGEIILIARATAAKSITNSIGMKLVSIPAGTFVMGSPESEQGHRDDESQHEVKITKPYYMATTEVTQAQWELVMGTTPWKGKSFAKSGSNYAASHISHDDAIEFCQKLSRKEGKTYRLPTEAEWEYACRAESDTVYSFGDSVRDLGQYAWFDENAWDVDEKYAHLVGKKKPNAFGLFDMHGNVWEWCQDRYDEDYYKNSPRRDPIGPGPAAGPSRVLRGGSWNLLAARCRSALRRRGGPTHRPNYYGFRVVLVR